MASSESPQAGRHPALTPDAAKKIAQEKVTLSAKVSEMKRDLGRDMAGDDVLTLQKILKHLGYFQAEPNGNFGPATEAALVQFKIDYRLAAEKNRNEVQTKRCGANTRAKLQEILLGKTATISHGVHSAVTKVVRPESAKPAPNVPRNATGEIARLAGPPPEWKEKNPAAYALYERIVGAVANNNQFPKSKTSAPSRAARLFGPNEEILRREYEKVLAPYNQNAHKVAKELCDVKSGSGWKAHLAVDPQDVAVVARFLQKKGFRHDYLQEGVGRTFGVYFGSRDTARQGVNIIQAEIGRYLKKPYTADERYPLNRELGANISGEFKVDRSALPSKGYKDCDVPGYGFGGLPVIAPFEQRNCKPSFYQVPPEQKKLLVLRDMRTAFRKLTEIFGQYFHG